MWYQYSKLRRQTLPPLPARTAQLNSSDALFHAELTDAERRHEWDHPVTDPADLKRSHQAVGHSATAANELSRYPDRLRLTVDTRVSKRVALETSGIAADSELSRSPAD